MKLTVLTYICLSLFCVMLAIGNILDFAWLSLCSLLPLVIAVLTVFHKRHFRR